MVPDFFFSFATVFSTSSKQVAVRCSGGLLSKNFFKFPIAFSFDLCYNLSVVQKMVGIA